MGHSIHSQFQRASEVLACFKLSPNYNRVGQAVLSALCLPLEMLRSSVANFDVLKLEFSDQTIDFP